MTQRDYIAFISYRHKPLDTQVAERLHSMIERYVIPRGLEGDFPNRRLGYVFRDRDELPISSDLTGDICAALDRSRFLIVICTPDTPESAWVRREIDYFIKKHGRERVLAVLAGGSPAESFPRELVELPEGGITEPLAADIVGRGEGNPLRGLALEKHRILAALIGCAYDDLVQRERRYQRRRAALIGGALALVALAFIGMLLVKNREITLQNQQLVARDQVISEKNDALEANAREILSQQQALEVQNAELRQRESVLLGNAARRAIDGDDVPGAVSLAMDALVEDGAPREYYNAEAEQVLFEALAPYDFGEACIESALSLDNDVAALAATEDGARLFIMDLNGRVTCYDPAAASVLWTQALASGQSVAWRPALCCAQGRLIVKLGATLAALNAATGEPQWSHALETSDLNDYFVLSGDGGTIAVYEAPTLDSRRDLVFFSVADGAELGRISLRNEDPTHQPLPDVLNSRQVLGCFDGEGRRFFGCRFDGDVQYYYRVDLDAMALTDLYTVDNVSLSYGTCDEVFAMYYDARLDAMVALREPAGRSRFIRVEILPLDKAAEARSQFINFDDAWDRAYQAETHPRIVPTEHRLYGHVGRYLFAIDLDSLESCTYVFDDAVLALQPAQVNPNAFTVQTADGIYALAWVRGDTLTRTALIDPLELVPASGALPLGDGLWRVTTAEFKGENGKTSTRVEWDTGFGRMALVPRDAPGRVLVFATRPQPEDDVPALREMQYIRFDDASGLLFADAKGALRCIDPDTFETLAELPGDTLASADARVSPSSGAVLFKNAEGEPAIGDLEGGAVQAVEQPQYSGYFSIARGTARLSSGAGEYAGRLLSATLEYDSRLTWYLDGALQDQVDLPALPEGQWYDSGVYVNSEGYTLLFAPDDADAPALRCRIWSLEGGGWASLDIPGAHLSTPAIAMADGRPAFCTVTDQNRLGLYDLSQAETLWTTEMPCVDQSLRSLIFVGGDRYVAAITREGRYYIYDAADGRLLSSGEHDFDIQYELASSAYAVPMDVNGALSADGNRLYLICKHGFTEGLCLDTRSWTPLARIPELVEYIPPIHALVVRDHDDSALHVVHEYALEDLLEDGRAMVAPMETSP